MLKAISTPESRNLFAAFWNHPMWGFGMVEWAIRADQAGASLPGWEFARWLGEGSSGANSQTNFVSFAKEGVESWLVIFLELEILQTSSFTSSGKSYMGCIWAIVLLDTFWWGSFGSSCLVETSPMQPDHYTCHRENFIHSFCPKPITKTFLVLMHFCWHSDERLDPYRSSKASPRS